MATEQLIKKLNVYGIIIKTQSRCNGLYFTLLLFTINWFINIFVSEVYDHAHDAHIVITKVNSYFLAFSFYDTLNRALSGVNYIILAGLATHLFHSFKTSTNCNTNNTLLDRPLSHRTHTEMKYMQARKIFSFSRKLKRGNEKKAEISLNIILASATDEKFKTFHWQVAVILKETDVQTDWFFCLSKSVIN